ncbi:FAD:protein FMN transferase [Ascidiimonas aurantiaca]|uniref:FAD:protein FMN transferase n=1 Tax=Ascidiimonas aurantiaca TaxID=1685432 RepID=UPI0030EEAED3
MKQENGFALGTTYSIKYEVPSDTIDLGNAIEQVFTVVNNSMSTYLPTSQVSRVNRGDSAVVVDSYFQEVYHMSKKIWEETEGAFDPTVGSLVNAWGFGPEEAIKNIQQRQIDSILQLVGMDKVKLTEKGTIIKKSPHVFLDFNAIAKGYTIDLLGALLESKGIENYLIELGGEILTRGKNTRLVKNWVVAIDHPLQQENERKLIAKVKLEDKAMATSGNYRKYRVDDKTGELYVHILNGKTGYPQKSNVLSVSVVAPTCMEADAYATAFMIMELDKTKALLKRLPHVEAYIIISDKEGDIQKFVTRGFQELLIE